MGNEYLTMAEMEAKYPGQWVLLDRTRYKQGMIVGGVVLAHSADRDEFDAQAERVGIIGKCVYNVYDPDEEPIDIITRFFEEEWTSDSTLDGPSSTSEAG